MTIMLSLLGFIGCSNNPVINGKVLDIWNKPVEGAMVQMEDVGENEQTDSSGSFSFTLTTQQDTNIRFRAGATGYIHDVEVIVYSTEEEQAPAVTFNLYPEPSEKGFYAIGASEYLKLPGQVTKKVSTKLEAYHGLSDIGTVSFSNDDKQQLVFFSSLRKEQIKQIALSLHQVTFKEQEDVKGVLGETAVDINLWMVSGKETPFGLRSLDQDHMYLIEFQEPLAKGVYAFHSGGYLTNTDPKASDTLPEEMKVAYPFEVK
jgi:hypothetical protein